jgi:hypothetical protein
MYEERLVAERIPKVAMHPARTFASLSRKEILAHAHHLIDGVKLYAQYAHDPEKAGKTGRHLASIQMCLSFAGWYTLDDLKDHNR